MRARHAAAVVSDTGDACDRTALFKWPRGFVPTRGGAVIISGILLDYVADSDVAMPSRVLSL